MKIEANVSKCYTRHPFEGSNSITYLNFQYAGFCNFLFNFVLCHRVCNFSIACNRHIFLLKISYMSVFSILCQVFVIVLHSSKEIRFFLKEQISCCCGVEVRRQVGLFSVFFVLCSFVRSHS